MAKAFCAVCGQRWHYWQPGTTEITEWVEGEGQTKKTVKKRVHYHKQCYRK